MNIATEFNEFKEDTLFNKKTTYFIWMIWNYMGKQTKVLIHWHRLLVYSAPTYVWSLNMKSVIYLSDCNWTWTQNYLVRKRTLNYSHWLSPITHWLSPITSTIHNLSQPSSVTLLHLWIGQRRKYQKLKTKLVNYWLYIKYFTPKMMYMCCTSKKKEGGRGLISIEECVEDAIAALQHYVQNSQERLISAAWRSSGNKK